MTNKHTIVTYKIIKIIRKILTIFTILNFCNANAQVSDTLTYVKSFEANKANYIGQPFLKLLNEMTLLKPKYIFTYYNNSSIMFCNEENLFDLGTVNMLIYWQKPIPSLESEYYEKKNNFNFTTDEKSYYQSKIIRNILVYTSN